MGRRRGASRMRKSKRSAKLTRGLINTLEDDFAETQVQQDAAESNRRHKEYKIKDELMLRVLGLKEANADEVADACFPVPSKFDDAESYRNCFLPLSYEELRDKVAMAVASPDLPSGLQLDESDERATDDPNLQRCMIFRVTGPVKCKNKTFRHFEAIVLQDWDNRQTADDVRSTLLPYDIFVMRKLPRQNEDIADKVYYENVNDDEADPADPDDDNFEYDRDDDDDDDDDGDNFELYEPLEAGYNDNTLLGIHIPCDNKDVVEVRVTAKQYKTNLFRPGARFAVHFVGFVDNLRMEIALRSEVDELSVWPAIQKGESNQTEMSKKQVRVLAERGPSFLHSLNSSQKRAAVSFAEAQSGLHIVQGPPGTGKTTMIISLLRALYWVRPRPRILVSAPSNKALQLLAKEFMLKEPGIQVMLDGVEEKLLTDPDLRRIYFATYQDTLKRDTLSIIADLEALSLSINDHGVRQALVRGRDLCKRVCWGLFSENEVKRNTATYRSLCKEIVEAMAEGRVYESELHKVKMLFDRLGAWLSDNICNKFDPLHDYNEAFASDAFITFASLSVTFRQSIRSSRKYDILIIDEASQALETQVMIALIAAKPLKCLMVGDPRQLPALITSNKARECRLDRSLMDRLLSELDYPYVMLDQQYRMRPEISLWPNRMYYAGRLRDSKYVREERLSLLPDDLPPHLGPYSFIDCMGKEEMSGTSFVNEVEIAVVVQVLKDLKEHGVIGDKNVSIGVITFYMAQVRELEKAISKFNDDVIMSQTTVHTVDSFQGREVDVLIISFVRSNAHGMVGFVEDEKRLNVALTRAKQVLVMVGNFETLEGVRGADVSCLMKDLRDRDLVFSQVTYYPDVKLEYPTDGARRYDRRASQRDVADHLKAFEETQSNMNKDRFKKQESDLLETKYFEAQNALREYHEICKESKNAPNAQPAGTLWTPSIARSKEKAKVARERKKERILQCMKEFGYLYLADIIRKRDNRKEVGETMRKYLYVERLSAEKSQDVDAMYKTRKTNMGTIDEDAYRDNPVNQCLMTTDIVSAAEMRTPLMEAALWDRVDVVEHLVEEELYQTDVNTRNHGYWTALLFATLRGNMKLVVYLMDKGADPTVSTKHGMTPLLLAREHLGLSELARVIELRVKAIEAERKRRLECVHGGKTVLTADSNARFHYGAPGSTRSSSVTGTVAESDFVWQGNVDMDGQPLPVPSIPPAFGSAPDSAMKRQLSSSHGGKSVHFGAPGSTRSCSVTGTVAESDLVWQGNDDLDGQPLRS